MASQFVNWIKSPSGRAYFFSTHFWGPVANWGLPLAALADMQKDESLISGVMSPTMAAYSTIFMRFAWQVQPRNYLLFACHATNATAQFIQTGRFVNYWYMGGKESRPEQIAEGAESAVLSAVRDAEGKTQNALDAAKAHATAGGEDALRRGQEIKEEAKRELAVAKDFVAGKVSSAETEASKAAAAAEQKAAQAEKKGWAFWRSAKTTASTEAAQLEHDAAKIAQGVQADAAQAKQATVADLEAAKQHVKAGGEDALRRAQEIKAEAGRELGEAKDYLPKVEVEKAKKGWFS